MGDFNGWDKESHRLAPIGGPGVWEGFVAGVGKGAVYKYHVVSRRAGYRVDKADPFAVMQEKLHALFMAVDIEVVDAARVEGGGPALDAMDDIAFGNQQGGQIGAVLPGDAGDECDFVRHDSAGSSFADTSEAPPACRRQIGRATL